MTKLPKVPQALITGISPSDWLEAENSKHTEGDIE